MGLTFPLAKNSLLRSPIKDCGFVYIVVSFKFQAFFQIICSLSFAVSECWTLIWHSILGIFYVIFSSCSYQELVLEPKFAILWDKFGVIGWVGFAGMGTKIQSKGCLSGYSSIWGSNESVKNDVLSLYHDGKGLKNYQHYDPVLPQKLMVGGQQQLGYDMEKVRQMILEHESTFRHQVYISRPSISLEIKIRALKLNCD